VGKEPKLRGTPLRKVRHHSDGEKYKRPNVDIAIIGAGVSGLYVAWRLLSEAKSYAKSIALFDSADRVGGRIHSVTVPGVPYVTDLGAMRYLPEQILVQSLIEDHFQLKCSDFQFENYGYYLRGKFISQRAIDLAKTADPPRNVFPYDVDEAENGKTPVDLIVLSIQRALRLTQMPDLAPGQKPPSIRLAYLRQKLRDLDERALVPNLVNHFTGAEWNLIRRHGHLNGRPLYEISFWDLIQQFLTREGYKLAHDGRGGCQHLNAADAIVWFLADFTGSPYRTVVGGMGQLVEKLREEIVKRSSSAFSGGELEVVNLGWELRDVRHGAPGDSEYIQLTFGLGEFVGVVPRGEMKTISAAIVILALPQPALKLINFCDFQIAPGDSSEQTALRLNSTLNTVTANSLFKAFVAYKKPWWRAEKIPSSFRVVTDLPIRHVYHFGVERQRQLSTGSKLRSACLLLLFVDAWHADYWKRLDEESQAQSGCSSEFEGSIDKSSPCREFRRIVSSDVTEDAVLARIQNQLAQAAGKTAPTPIALVLKHWSDRPYHTGWHAWNVGARSWEIREKLVRPFLHANLFICGEAFSSEQGWIEGALKSAERVLEKMGLPSPPSWVNQAKYDAQKELWT
jgi:monoamine oxidase